MDSAVKSSYPFPSFTTNELLVFVTNGGMDAEKTAAMLAEINRRRTRKTAA